jgi:rod shape-determining protein MreB
VPRSFTLNSNEILEAMQEPLQASCKRSRKHSSRRRQSWAPMSRTRGIVLTGGGALLKDIDKLLMEETGLPVVIAEDPLTCVARGGGRILELSEEHPGLFWPRLRPD